MSGPCQSTERSTSLCGGPCERAGPERAIKSSAGRTLAAEASEEQFMGRGARGLLECRWAAHSPPSPHVPIRHTGPKPSLPPRTPRPPASRLRRCRSRVRIPRGLCLRAGSVPSTGQRAVVPSCEMLTTLPAKPVSISTTGPSCAPKRAFNSPSSAAQTRTLPSSDAVTTSGTSPPITSIELCESSWRIFGKTRASPRSPIEGAGSTRTVDHERPIAATRSPSGR